MGFDLSNRAGDISEFLNVTVDVAEERLGRGFHANHALVAADFHAAGARADDEASLLEWYRTTDAYIWELSAYHLERDFNYMGMCQGIATHLLTVDQHHVLVLGDGVGDLSNLLAKNGLDPTYHDLARSRTAAFAEFVSTEAGLASWIARRHTEGWEPVEVVPNEFDAVVALDFFEHLINVEAWARRVYEALRPGGIFLAQNAFGIGDEEHGNSIPMHLAVNNRYVDEWPQLMQEIGFELQPSQWWQK